MTEPSPAIIRSIITSVPAWQEARRGFKHKAPQGKHTPETQQCFTANLCCQTHTGTDAHRHTNTGTRKWWQFSPCSHVHSFSHLHICTWIQMHKINWISRREGGRWVMKDRRWGTAVGRRAEIQRCEIFADILAVRETECNLMSLWQMCFVANWVLFVIRLLRWRGKIFTVNKIWFSTPISILKY